jgi:hypothetical protein
MNSNITEPIGCNQKGKFVLASENRTTNELYFDGLKRSFSDGVIIRSSFITQGSFNSKNF